jgi:hypothetical protein
MVKVLNRIKKEFGNYQILLSENPVKTRRSLRNWFLESLGLCACTNMMHGHRAGIHARNDKHGACPKCHSDFAEAS